MQVLLYLFSMLFALEDLLKSDGDRVCLQIMCYLTAVTDRVAFFHTGGSQIRVAVIPGSFGRHRSASLAIALAYICQCKVSWHSSGWLLT